MIQSLLYRLIIIFIAIYIVLNKNIEIIPLWGYFCIMFVYLLVYWQLKKYEKSILRLLLDFIFVNIIISNTNLYTPIIFLLIILPIINAINFSGKTSHYFLLICLICMTFFIHTFSFPFEVCVSIGCLSLMYGYSKFKSKEGIIEQEISNHIDNYFLNPEEIEKPHNIYKQIINDLNNFFDIGTEEQTIKKISAYTLKGNVLWLINSSEFMWQRRMELNDEDIIKLRKETILEKQQDSGINTLYYYIKRESVEYVFYCEYIMNLWLVLYNYKKVLKLTFSKASMLLNADYRIKKLRDIKFNEIKDNVLYVNNAVKVMHFIRNKMTPLSNVLAYFRLSNTISEQMKLQMNSRVEKEAKQAEKDLDSILKIANDLLDKSKNPFYSESKDITVTKLFIIISEIVESYLNAVVEVNDYLKEEENIKLCVNIVESKIMFTDWVANMQKYRKNYHKTSMFIRENQLVVHFENDYSSSHEIHKLVDNLNNNDKDAVIVEKCHGHGINIMKGLANNLGVSLMAKIEKKEEIGNVLCLDFKFNIV